jgi:hypothetical protein
VDTAGNPGGSQDQAVRQPSSNQPSLRPVGPLTVFAFEAYFLLLGICTTYALWMIWPYSGAPASVRVFGLAIDFSNDVDARLLLIALLAGLLGALIHITTSFATYLGNQSFYGSWISWYVMRPLIGMILGLLFYFIVRAGLVTSSGANALNPFGVAAVSGLAGLFSKQTVDKLRDIFEHAFPVTSGGDLERRGSLAPAARPASGEGAKQGGPSETGQAPPTKTPGS